jgi:hypothetical protein
MFVAIAAQGFAERADRELMATGERACKPVLDLDEIS